MDKLKAELHATREKNGVYIPAEQFDAREKTSAFMGQRVESLEAELEAAREAAKLELEATREAAAQAAAEQAAKLAQAQQVGSLESRAGAWGCAAVSDSASELRVTAYPDQH